MFLLRYGSTIGIMILIGILSQETYAYAFTSPNHAGSQILASSIRLRNQESSALDTGKGKFLDVSTATRKPLLTIMSASHNDGNNDIHPNPNRLQTVKTQIKNLMKKAVSMRHKKNKLTTAFAILTLCISTMFSLPNEVLASSGGRMGGSFKSSSSRSYSSSPSYSPSSSRSYSGNSRLYGRTYSRGPSVIVSPSYRRPGVTVVRTPSAVGYVIPIALYGSIVYFNNRNRKDNDFRNGNGNSSALGPGVSVVSLSVGLDVRDRDDPSCILARLKRLSLDANTQSRSGVQNLVSEVCLELIRQQIHIFAASTSYKHYTNEADASRGFNTLSIKERSKFDRETVNKFGGIDNASSQPLEEVTSNNDEGARTSAIVTILLSIEGNKTKPRERMNCWQDLWDGIHLISADAKVDDCLLSAEILWTPEDRSDSINRRDIAADYPDLRII